MFTLNLARHFPSFLSHRAPIWGRGVARNAFVVCVLIVSICVMLAAVAFGEHYARHAIRDRERLVANDMIHSVERILQHVLSPQRDALDRLSGRPCVVVAKRLAELKTYIRYVRGVNLVENERLYCSSALGPMDVPLAAYISNAQREQGLSLIQGTPFQPTVPVLPVFRSTDHATGLLYVIEASYVTDVLAHGQYYGVGKVTLSVAGSGSIDEQGMFSAARVSEPRSGTRAASTVFPFSLAVTASPAFVSTMRWKYGAICCGVGILLNLLMAAIYLLAFAPRRLLLSAVRQGLRKGQFYVAYQPIVDIANRRVVGVEALIRWTHPRYGPINPAVFMAEVESSSLLGDITRFMLQRAVTEAGRLADGAPFRIAVNVAPMDLERKGFVSEVIALTRVLPHGTSLVLEVTERFFLDRHPRVARIFASLREHGVRFALDDFGTQHSNLDQLGRFPFDFVKIDRQFIEQVDKDGAGLIEGIAAVAQHYGMAVVAEGVETEAQHDALLRLRIPFGQGYLYRRPVPAGEIFGAPPVVTTIAEVAGRTFG